MDARHRRGEGRELRRLTAEATRSAITIRKVCDFAAVGAISIEAVHCGASAPETHSREAGVIFNSSDLPSRSTVMVVGSPTFSSDMSEV
jgi:hypothetical protein